MPLFSKNNGVRLFISKTRSYQHLLVASDMKQTAVHSELNEGEVGAHSLSEGKEIRRRRGEVKRGIIFKGNRNA